MIVCKKCGGEVWAGASTCTVCAAPLRATWTGHAPSIIISGPEPETGDEVIQVHDPGARSIGRLKKDGSVELSVEGAGGVGRSGEGRVKKTLRQKLAQDGTAARFEPGRDEYGEDAILQVGDVSLTFQIVTAPQARTFWQEASRTSATTQVSEVGAARWLETAIESKALRIPADQRAKTVLAVDARHVGFLAAKPILDVYTRRFGDPVRKYGFASVWVVGPDAPHCSRIGSGQP